MGFINGDGITEIGILFIIKIGLELFGDLGSKFSLLGLIGEDGIWDNLAEVIMVNDVDVETLLVLVEVGEKDLEWTLFILLVFLKSLALSLVFLEHNSTVVQ